MFEVQILDPVTDFPRLSNLLNLIGSAETTEQAQREQTESLAGLGFFGQWVIPDPEDQNRLIAQASLFKLSSTPYAEFTISIDPDFGQHNLNTLLLYAIRGEAKKQRATYISAFANQTNPSLESFLLEHRFKIDGAFRSLELEVPRALPVVNIDSQFRISTHEQVQNLSILVEIANRGWADLPGHKIATFEIIQRNLEASPEEQIFLAFDGAGNVAAQVGIAIHGGVGKIDSPGIAREYRTPELYKQLVLLGLHELQNKGCKQVQMYSWGDSDSTIAAYTDLGFQITAHEDRYKLDLI